jgi:hypothetical protein
MPDIARSLTARAALAAPLVLLVCAPAAAQWPSPYPDASAGFFTRFDFHLSAIALVKDDPRFSWDTRWGTDFDFVDYGVGRTSFLVDYQAVLGEEFRPFDANQANYMLESSASIRTGKTEFAGAFNHVSRHLSDRTKLPAVAWNTLKGRVLRRISFDVTSVDVVGEFGPVLQHAFVDYRWFGQLDLLVRRPVTPRVGVFAHGTGQVYGVDESVSDRDSQVGAVGEGGIRVNGGGGILEVYAGYERRVDADPFDRQIQSWFFVGVRLVGR